MKFYDRTGKHHKSFLGAMGASILSKIDESLTEKARGYREAGEDRYDETPGAYTGGKKDDDESEDDGLGTSSYNPFVMRSVDNIEEFPAVQHEAPSEPAQKISIDYAHQRIILEDASGNIIATSPIDEKLVRGTIDGTLLDVLYPDGNVPEAVKMNVESTPVTAKPVILDSEGKPFPSIDDTPSPDGSCG